MTWRRLVVVAVLAHLVSATPASAHGGSGADYRWVGTDAGAAPLGRSAELTVGVPADVWTPDAQAVLSLPAEALAGAPGAVVTVSLQPDAVDDLAALPDGMAAAGNAYRVELALAAPGRIVLATAHATTAVLHSADGTDWQVVPHSVAGDGRVDAPLAGPGWYVVATSYAHARPPLAWWLLAVGGGGILAGAARRLRAGRT